jgi:hypothetical protein
MGPQLVRRLGGRVVRGFAFLRLGTDDAGGLISRCGHYRLPHLLRAMHVGPKPGDGTINLGITLTEPFGQCYISGH